MVEPAGGSPQLLPQRLKSLRKEGWPGRRITQQDLAEALGASISLISSWESERNPAVPPPYRIESYAAFFATERSVAKRPYRVLDDAQLTDEERQRRDDLYEELVALRNGAQEQPAAAAPLADGELWRFSPNQDITIVGSELPQEELTQLPHTRSEDPDYVEMYRFADLDALFELFGHVRACNPTNDVHLRTPSDLQPDDYTTHLVLIGGVDWNAATADLIRRLNLPVRQRARESEAEQGGFEIVESGHKQVFRPVLAELNGAPILTEDVGHFYRAPNPFNIKRTVTICNGMYQRGTLGAVRALTDAKFRSRNGEHVRQRFAGRDTFSIVSRVHVVQGVVVTPDWTRAGIRLHEWPE